MTRLRDDREIEQLLQATLTNRADTVRTGPGWQPALQRRRTPRWLAPLVAAAAVLVVAGSVVAIGHSRGHRTGQPPAGHTSAPAPIGSVTPSPTPRRPGVTLRWPADTVAGYTLANRSLTRQFSLEQFVKTGDPQATAPGGGPQGVIVRRWALGTFAPSDIHHAVAVGAVGTGGTAYDGTCAAGLFAPGLPLARGSLPTLAVEYTPGRWLTLIGQTDLTRRTAELLRLGREIARQAATTVTAVPLEFRGLPLDTAVQGATEDVQPGHPYGLTIDLASGRRASTTGADRHSAAITVQIWRRPQVPFSPTAGTITADGRPGVLDPSRQEAAFRIGRRLVTITYDGPGATPATFRAVLATVRWASDPARESTWFDGSALLG